MTTLSNISATANALATPMAHASQVVSNTQSKKGFWRKIKHSKNLITLESSAGGMVQIPISELWKLGEAHDANLQIPVAAKAS